MKKLILGCLFILVFSSIQLFPTHQESQGAWILVRAEPYTKLSPNGGTVNGTETSGEFYWKSGQDEYYGTTSWSPGPASLIPGKEYVFQRSGKSWATIKNQYNHAGIAGVQLTYHYALHRADGSYANGDNITAYDTLNVNIGEQNHSAQGARPTKPWSPPGGSEGIELRLNASTGGLGSNAGCYYIYKWDPDYEWDPESEIIIIPLPEPPTPPPPQKKEIGQTDSNCDLALNRPARQSSTAFSGVASNAVDGDNTSLTNTEYEKEAWWEVDLRRECQINFVYLWNRDDVYAEWLSDFYLLVSKNPFPEDTLEEILKDPDIWRFQFNGQPPLKQRLDVNFQGRYVRIQNMGTNFLSIAELEVCGWEFTSSISQKETGKDKRPGETEIISRIVGNKGNCRPDWGYFDVPEDKLAYDFRYAGLVSGYDCQTTLEILRRGFTIHKNDAMWTRVYSYSVNENGQSFEMGGPLPDLVLTPGSYLISVDGGYDAEVKVFFKLR